MNLVESNATHLDSLYHLWNCCLGDKWPVSKDDLHLYLFTDRDGFHKENLAFIKEDRLVAFIAVHRAGEKAGIFLLLVDPEYRRRGLATRLFEEAVSRQGTAGVCQVLVGSVGCGYLWPGVPDNCPETIDFLISRGFPKPGRMFQGR